MEDNNKLSFKGQHFFIGIEVDSKKWVVCIRCNQIELKRFAMNPDPEQLAEHMNRNYPGGMYHSAYEAGFCGFSIHKRLKELGFDSMVTNPADIPTTNKEKVNKNDRIDSGKISRELENKSLKAIYVPDEFYQGVRSLSRLRRKTMEQIVRIKSRIKGHLYYYGIKLPSEYESYDWSNKFVKGLKSLKIDIKGAKDYLDICLTELSYEQTQLTRIVQRIFKHLRDSKKDKIIERLQGFPGIGETSAMVLYLEIMDINRFPALDNLCSFFGLIPSTHDSGESEQDNGITPRRNKYIRHVIIEAAWMAIRKDPALLLSFNKLTQRMKKQNAIIKIAKKLVSRIRYVWKNEVPYVYGLVD